MTEMVDNEGRAAKTQFGIQHLLGFMTVVAIAVVCAFPDSTLPGTPNPQDRLWWFAFRGAEFLIGVLCLSGAAIVLSRWLAERKFPVEPGRILLLFCALGFLTENLVEWLALIFTRAFEGATVSDEDRRILLSCIFGFQTLTRVFVIGVSIFGMRRDRWWWRVSFFLLALNAVAAIATYVVHIMFVQNVQVYTNIFTTVRTVASAMTTISSLAILIACIIDFARRAKRSRLHLWGIGCYLLSVFLPWVLFLIAFEVLGFKGLFNVQ